MRFIAGRSRKLVSYAGENDCPPRDNNGVPFPILSSFIFGTILTTRLGEGLSEHFQGLTLDK